MKKIALVLIFAFVGFFSNAQMPIVKQYVVNDTLTSDTTYWIWTSTNYAWRLYVEYSINNGTTTTVIPVTKTTSTATAQEFALINNFNINKDVEEYEAFQTFRAECKGIADNVMEQ